MTWKLEQRNMQRLNYLIHNVCELWNIESLELAQLELAWRKSCRLILNLHPRTHNILLPQLMNTNHIKKIVQERFLNALGRGIIHKNNLISSIFKNTIIIKLAPVCTHLNGIIKNCNKVLKI